MSCIDMSGRSVACDPSDWMAIGMYLLDPNDPQLGNTDCGALVPVKVVTGHRMDENGDYNVDVVYGCKGITDTYEYPDVFITDDMWKPYLVYVLGAIAIALLIKIILLAR